jgi:hypothetical protein
MTWGGPAKRWLWTLAMVGYGAAAACTPGSSSGPVSCDQAADHLSDICGAYAGEKYRAVCEIEDVPLLTPADRRCAAELESCDPHEINCELRDVTIECSSDDDCPTPFSCVALDGEGECVRCKSDADCEDADRGCALGLCFDKASQSYEQAKALDDAGVSAR